MALLQLPFIYEPPYGTAMSLLDALANDHCQPRRGDEHRLSDARRDEGMAALEGWKLDADGNAMHRQFDFDDYHRTMAFVNALAFVAHREDHHPDLEEGDLLDGG